MSKFYTTHAEQDCIAKCPKKLLPKSTLLLVRETIGDDIKSCEKCMKLINKYKIKSIKCISIRT